jgi:hypothetical protein
MSPHDRFTLDQARAAGERIGIDWDASPFSLEQFRMGLDVELEHGTADPQTNVTGDDVIMTAKIARAHLNEFPDYYTRLAKMEAEAEVDGTARGGVSAQASWPPGPRPCARPAAQVRHGRMGARCGTPIGGVAPVRSGGGLLAYPARPAATRSGEDP